MPDDSRTGLAIFASGTGSNAREIIRYFTGHTHIGVRAVFTNNPEAGVLTIAHKAQVPSVVFTRRILNDPALMLPWLDALHIDRIILAGFLLLIPEYLIDRYPNRIINIHPALLPKYGGKGMYGMHVHKAVRRSGDTETGITIHLVNPQYDEGEIVAQYSVVVAPEDSPGDIASKVHALEHQWYPAVIEQWVMSEHVK